MVYAAPARPAIVGWHYDRRQDVHFYWSEQRPGEVIAQWDADRKEFRRRVDGQWQDPSRPPWQSEVAE